LLALALSLARLEERACPWQAELALTARRPRYLQLLLAPPQPVELE
jgi:hypothetical protein